MSSASCSDSMDSDDEISLFTGRGMPGDPSPSFAPAASYETEKSLPPPSSTSNRAVASSRSTASSPDFAFF